MGSHLFCDVFYPELTMINPLGASVFVFDHDLKIRVEWLIYGSKKRLSSADIVFCFERMLYLVYGIYFEAIFFTTRSLSSLKILSLVLFSKSFLQSFISQF